MTSGAVVYLIWQLGPHINEHFRSTRVVAYNPNALVAHSLFCDRVVNHFNIHAFTRFQYFFVWHSSLGFLEARTKSQVRKKLEERHEFAPRRREVHLKSCFFLFHKIFKLSHEFFIFWLCGCG